MKKIVLAAATLLMGSSLFAQKFAQVDFQECVYLMDDIVDASIQMQSVQKETTDTYNEMVKDYQAKAEAYQTKQSTWTASVKDSKGRELADLEQRIQEFAQTSQQELQQIQQNLMAPIVEKVQNAVDEIAAAAGYSFVFDKGSVRYISAKDCTDITKDVRTKLGIPADRTLEGFQAEQQAKLEAAAATK
ncbi:MAG: OmpH family outer membrane protein [Bacteroidales bacterium]|nr:OmpH family outer membrane protein [Bacteroidales bacterium]